LFGNIVDQLLALFPTQAGIGNGFPVAAFADLLVAVFNIAFKGLVGVGGKFGWSAFCYFNYALVKI
jgi:hypothetical protein